MIYASTSNYHDLRAAADAIDEVTENLTYIGLCAPGCDSPDRSVWSICRIQKTGNITYIMWAQGQCAFNLQFSERENYEYTFKKF